MCVKMFFSFNVIVYTFLLIKIKSSIHSSKINLLYSQMFHTYNCKNVTNVSSAYKLSEIVQFKKK